MAGRTVPPRVETAPSEAPRVYARRPFQYGDLDLDRGQVFILRGAINDEKLLRLGYVAELGRGAQLYECAVCGAQFVGMGERTGHGDARHRPQPARDPRSEDAHQDAQERMLEQVAPLYLDRTAASGA